MEAKQSDFMPSRATPAPRRSQAGKPLPLTLVRPWRNSDKLVNRALNYLYPWTRHDYPGLQASAVALFGRGIRWSGVQHWLSGRARLPTWAAETMAAKLRANATAANALADELDIYLASQARTPPRHMAPGMRRRTDD